MKKRIALSVVAALAGGLLAAAPASATVSVTAPVVAGTNVARSGSTAAAITLTPGTAFAANDDMQITLLTRNGVTLAEVPAGVSAASATATGVVTGNKIDINAAANETVVTLTVASSTAPGKYTFSAATKATASSDYSGSTAATGTFYVSGAASAVAFDKAAYTGDTAPTTATAKLSLTDTAGNPTYLLSGEAVQVLSSSSSATVSTVLLDSGNYTQADATTGYKSLTLSSTTAGAYTFTASAVAGLTGVASAASSFTVTTAPISVTGASIAAGTLANGVNGNSVAGTSASNASAGAAAVSLYVSTAQASVTFKATIATGATAGTHKYVISQTSNVPFPGGVTAGTFFQTAAVDATDSTGTDSSLTVSSSAPLAGTGYTLTIKGVTNDLVYTVLYQAPVAYNIALSDTLATTLAAVKLATTSQTVKVTDQFGVAFPGATVSYVTAGRNAIAVKTAIADASGLASVSATDTAATSSALDDTLTASVASVTVTGAAAQTTSAATTIKYAADAATITPASVTNTVTQPTTPGTTATYATDITTATSPAVTVDTVLDNSANDQSVIADQIAVSAVVKNAAAGTIVGIPVSVSGSAGVYFLAGSTLGEVKVGSQTGAKTTLAGFTTTNGVYAFQAGFTKAGTATITVTAGAVSKTYTITVNAGVAAIVSASAAANGVVTAKVTDLWGNAVAGKAVSFTAASGAQLGGNFSSLTSNTGTDGTTSVQATTAVAGSYVVTAAITGDQSAVAADTTNGLPKGIASATAAVTVAATVDPAVVAAEKAGADAVAAAKLAQDAATAAGVAAAAAADKAAAAAAKAGTDAVAAAGVAKAAADAAAAAAAKAGVDAAAAAAAAGVKADAATAAAKAASDAVAALSTSVASLQTTVASLVASMTAQIKVINSSMLKIAKKLGIKI